MRVRLCGQVTRVFGVLAIVGLGAVAMAAAQVIPPPAAPGGAGAGAGTGQAPTPPAPGAPGAPVAPTTRAAVAGAFQIAVPSSTTTTLDLPLPDSGVVPITVLRAGATPPRRTSSPASGFQDSSGGPVEATLTAAGSQPAASVLSGLTAETGVTQLMLRVKPVPSAGIVSGVLTVTADTTNSWRVNLSRGGKPTATLVVDNPQIVRALTCHWFWGCGTELGDASVRVWDKAHAWPIANLAVRLEQVTKTGAEFDGPKHLQTSLNGTPMDLWSASKATDASREIPASGQGLVGFTIRDLRPGEYNTTLRFAAANSLTEDNQKVTFQVTVKHSILWALLLVLAGLVASLFGTKWLAALRKRLDIESTLSQLNAPWVRQEPPTAAVVWTLANLRLIREGTRASRLSIPDSIAPRVDSVRAVVGVLRTVHDVRIALDAAPVERNMPSFVAARAAGVLNGIVRRSDEPPLDAAVVSGLTDQLKALQVWFAPTGWEEPYWADLAPALRSLIQDVRPEDVPSTAGQNALRALRELLTPHAIDNPPRPPKVVDVERCYAALKVLWERRESPEFDELVAAHSTQRLEEVFRIADDRAWTRLEAAVKNGQVTIEHMSALVQELEPFTLAVVPSDRQLGATFLFRHRLQYEWRIERVPTKATGRMPRLRQEKPFALTPRTLQPLVSQYAPYPMTLKAHVTIRRVASNAKPLELECPPFPVLPSDSLGLFSSFSDLDVWATAATGVVAAISGLSTFYFASPTFGAAKDYVALALWALAFDQAKNGIVQMSASAPAAASTPGAAAPGAPAKPPGTP